MMMRTFMPGSLAGTLPPGRNPAGRNDTPPAGGFDEAYRDTAGPASNPASPGGDTDGTADGTHRNVSGPNRWAYAFSGYAERSQDGRPGDGGSAGRITADGRENGPQGENAGKARKPARSAAADGRDGARTGSDRHGHEKDKDKHMAVAVTAQPSVDTPQRLTRKTDAEKTATEGSKGPQEAGTAKDASGKSRDSSAEAKARQAGSALTSARVVPDSGDAPSALSGLDARLSRADAQERLLREGGASRSPHDKASAGGKEGRRFLKAGAAAAPGAEQMSDTQGDTPSPSPSKRDARSNSDNVRQVATRDMGRTQDFAGSRKNAHAEDKSAAQGNTGQSVRPAGAISSAAFGAASANGMSLQAANTTALANGIAARPDWTQAFSAAATGAPGSMPAAGSVRAMTIQLNPASLGTVTATLRVSGNQLVIHLQVQTAEAYRQLSTGNDAILDKLKGHGYAVEAITVQHMVADRPGTTQQPQHAAFAAPQGSAGGLARGGQQMAGQGQGHHGGGQQPHADDAAPRGSNGAGASDSPDRRTDGVYV